MYIFKSIYLHLKYNRILKRVYKEFNIPDSMSQLLNVPVRVDWVNRLYMVLNPMTMDTQDQIYEITETGPNSDEFVKHWLMERLTIMDKFIKVNNLFDILTLKMEKLDQYGNYLVILEPITWYDFKKSIKYLLYCLPIIPILYIIISLIIKHF